MGKYFEHTCTRMYSLNLVKALAMAEKNLGLENSFFISLNGNVAQFVYCDEGEEFHKKLKEKLNNEYFNEICDKFLKL